MGKRLRPKLINKKVKKLIDKKCYFCSCNTYDLLDVHRIIPGEEGGQYTDYNSLTCCANCHRKIHSGIIKILGRHFSTTGKYVLNYWDKDLNQEFWK